MSDLNEILEIQKKKIDTSTCAYSKKNSIGITLKIVGRIIMVVGVLGGLILGVLLTMPASSVISNPNPLRWVYSIAIMISSFISGILFVGFGEIIILLNDIRYNVKSK